MTATMSTAPLEASREAAKAAGLQTFSKPGSGQDLQSVPGSQDSPEIFPAATMPPGSTTTSSTDQGPVPLSKRRNNGSGSPLPAQRQQAAPDRSLSPASGFLGLGGGAGEQVSPESLTQHVMGRGTPTAAKMARGIIAIGDMSAAACQRTAAAVGGAISDWTTNLMNQTPPLTQPLTISKSYVNRLSLAQRFTQPAAYAADVAAQYAGELLYWVLQAGLAVYYQLAAMKLLPQITAGKADASGVPLNPVSGGLPLASDELAAFKLVGAALLMAYVQVYDALEEAAQLLFRQASDAGQRYLAHRHGGEAADVAAAALGVAADMMTLSLNWFRLMGRAFFSKTATNTARSYLLQQLPDLHLD